MINQLALNIQFHDDTTFDSFYTIGNQTLFDYLKTFILQNDENTTYLWGEPGSGRSHLLQACCHALADLNKPAAYIPLSKHLQLSPEIFEGLENLALVCLDDIEQIAGKSAWEEALFHCYNRIQTTHTKLLIAANSPPAQLTFNLQDLRSRLQACIIFQVHTLNDAEKISALQMRAKLRGIDLNLEVGNFLLNRYPRNMQALFELLEKLDKASLAAQRKLTVPFVKHVLEI